MLNSSQDNLRNVMPFPDEIDLKIISNLIEDSRISMTDLAKKTGLSRPTVSARLKKLRENAILLTSSGLNLAKFGYKIANVSLEVVDETNRSEIEKILRICPRVLTGFRTSSKANYYASVWGENEQTIISTIESFRDFQGVNIIEINYLGTPFKGEIIIKPPNPEKKITPCGNICSECKRYENSLCLGCPTPLDYNNSSSSQL
jgi:DNA-binding Lrp family transcriptional regulator